LKANNLIFTEKIYYEKIINQIVDLIVYKFTELVIREESYSKSKFLEDLKEKIEEIKKWIKLKASQLNMALTRGKSPLSAVFQANRRDTFTMGLAKKSKSFNQSVRFRSSDNRISREY
jgi:uncharacterized membrane protein YgaE (UPF0421/DUF939 family)